MTNNKSITWIILSQLGGLLFFLILLLIVNNLSNNITNETFIQTINFINNNLNIIIILSIILFLGELFSAFIFPFNLPYPIFNALGSIFLVTFIFRIFAQIPTTAQITQQITYYHQSELILLIATIVLIVGYIKIFTPSQTPKEKTSTKTNQPTNWSDVENEFRELILFFSKKIRNTTKKNSKKKA